jgi:hypothetical protein
LIHLRRIAMCIPITFSESDWSQVQLCYQTEILDDEAFETEIRIAIEKKKYRRVEGEVKMQQFQEKQTSSCPNCGADGSKRTWRDAIGGNR